MENKEKILSAIGLIIIVIICYGSGYSRGYDNGYNEASQDWCNVFNNHVDLTNILIVELKKLDPIWLEMTELDEVDCGEKTRE